MEIRETEITDLPQLQKLYLHLHKNEKLPASQALFSLFGEIIADENYHIIVGLINEVIVSSVTVVVIKNLTRGMRPYALIENVVTHKAYRRKGYAQRLMQKAIDIAANKSCYKIMLLTGAKEPGTLCFYEKCGFNSKDKTAFVQWM